MLLLSHCFVLIGLVLNIGMMPPAAATTTTHLCTLLVTQMDVSALLPLCKLSVLSFLLLVHAACNLGKRETLYKQRFQLQQKSDASCLWCLYWYSCVNTAAAPYTAFLTRGKETPGAREYLNTDKTFPGLRKHSQESAQTPGCFIGYTKVWHNLICLKPLQPVSDRLKVKFIVISCDCVSWAAWWAVKVKHIPISSCSKTGVMT